MTSGQLDFKWQLWYRLWYRVLIWPPIGDSWLWVYLRVLIYADNDDGEGESEDTGDNMSKQKKPGQYFNNIEGRRLPMPR